MAKFTSNFVLKLNEQHIKYPNDVYNMTLKEMLSVKDITPAQTLKLIKVKQSKINEMFNCYRKQFNKMNKEYCTSESKEKNKSKRLNYSKITCGNVVVVNLGFDVGLVMCVVLFADLKSQTVTVAPISRKISDPIEYDDKIIFSGMGLNGVPLKNSGRSLILLNKTTSVRITDTASILGSIDENLHIKLREAFYKLM